ncbi:MAG: hypothetical protein NUV86_02110 [Candidatus Scalindua sp.]|nr:hypothetical protein [Candidatus Scalindua sp.]
MIKCLLREGVSFSPPFTVSELPHKAKLDQNEAPFDLPDEVKVKLRHGNHFYCTLSFKLSPTCNSKTLLIKKKRPFALLP